MLDSEDVDDPRPGTSNQAEQAPTKPRPRARGRPSHRLPATYLTVYSDDTDSQPDLSVYESNGGRMSSKIMILDMTTTLHSMNYQAQNTAQETLLPLIILNCFFLCFFYLACDPYKQLCTIFYRR